MPYGSVPKLVIKRLPLYLRILDKLIVRDVEVVSSGGLSEITGFTAEQIRKDFAFFGAFGTRGSGYNTEYLRERILKIIGLNTQTNVIIVGIGSLGQAICRYNSEKNPYIEVVGLFDCDPSIVGQKIAEKEVSHVREMVDFIRENSVRVAIITVPADNAQEVADQLVEGGVTAILNMAPARLKVPEGIQLHNADLTIEIHSLIYYSSEKSERDTNEWEIANSR
jgi:redox-sensing transcriptional repressor